MTSNNKPDQSRWDLSLLYISDDEDQIEHDIKSMQNDVNAFVAKWSTSDEFKTDVAQLKNLLDEYELILRRYANGGGPGYYAWLRSSEDKSNSNVKAMMSRLHDIETKLYNDLQFVELELGKVSKEKQLEFLRAKPLLDYNYFLKNTFEHGVYNLSEVEEKLINLKSRTSHGLWVNLVTEHLAKQTISAIDEKGSKQEIPFESGMSLMNDKDQKIRDHAATEINKVLYGARNIAEAEINAIFANKKVDDELRGYKRADTSRHVADQISTDTIDTALIQIAAKNNIAHEFYELKSKLLGKNKLQYHERNIPVGSYKSEFSYEKATKLVLDVLRSLDEKFYDHAKMFTSEGRIDVYPRENKSGGAFCVYGTLEQPVYLLLNYTNQLRDVTTLAHELGHALHNEFMREKQHALYFGTSMATAEVASQFFEDFVIEKLFEDLSEDEQLSIRMERIGDEISSVFRQVACYRFEQALHTKYRETGFVSSDQIGELFQKHMSEYMGDFVEQSPGSENWWIYWGHIRSFFYNYSYATGRLLARALQKQVRQDSANIEIVKTFLRSGSSNSAEGIFADAGIDITNKQFWLDGLSEIDDELQATKKLAQKLGKI